MADMPTTKWVGERGAYSDDDVQTPSGRDEIENQKLSGFVELAVFHLR